MGLLPHDFESCASTNSATPAGEEVESLKLKVVTSYKLFYVRPSSLSKVKEESIIKLKVYKVHKVDQGVAI